VARQKSQTRPGRGAAASEASTGTTSGGDGQIEATPVSPLAEPTATVPSPPVFDLGFALEQSPEIGQPLVAIASAVDDFERAIHNSMAACIARARVTNGSLTACLAAAIDQQQRLLAEQIVGYQQQIEVVVAGQLGTALEFASQGGVMLPILSAPTPIAQPILTDYPIGEAEQAVGPCDPVKTVGDITCSSDGRGGVLCWQNETGTPIWPQPSWASDCGNLGLSICPVGYGYNCPSEGGGVTVPPAGPPSGQVAPPPIFQQQPPTVTIPPFFRPPPILPPIGGPPVLPPPIPPGSLPPVGGGQCSAVGNFGAHSLYNWLSVGRPRVYCTTVNPPTGWNYTVDHTTCLVAAYPPSGSYQQFPALPFTDQDTTNLTAALARCNEPGTTTTCPVCQQQTCCCAPPPPQPERPPKYAAWATEGGVCYVLRAGDPPRLPADRILARDATLDAAQQAATSGCPPTPPSPPTNGGLILPNAGWPAGAWCEPAFLQSLGQPSGTLGTFDRYGFSKMIGWRDPNGNKVPIESLCWNIPVLKQICETLSKIGGGTTDFLGALASDAILALNCASGDKALVDFSRTLFGIAAQWIAPIFSEFQQPLEYKSHWLCPQLLPAPPDIDSAFLGGTITADLWEGWQRAQNQCPEPAQRVLLAKRSKPAPLQLSAMLRRGMISRQMLDEGYRQLGYLEQPVVDRLHNLTELLPPPSDIIRMMVRDADDPVIAATFGTDAQFTQKYGGQLKSWAAGQGMSDLAMQYLWRAHWTIPPPTQLFEMIHRLSRLPPTDPNYVSVADVTTALVQQDILPYWIPKLIAISYRVVTRTDAQKAFQIGAYTPQQLTDTYQDLGYDLPGAQSLVSTEFRTRHQRWLNNRWSKLYQSGGIDRVNFDGQLSSLGASPADLVQLRTDLDALRDAKTRLLCVKAERTNHLKGLTSGNTLYLNLVALGLDAVQARAIADGIICERSAQGKTITARRLCKYLEDGLITPAFFTQTLTSIGYDAAESAIILQSCQQGITAKQLAQAQRFARQQAAIAKQQQREADRTAKEQAAAAQRAIRQQEAQQRLGERREKSLGQSAEMLASKAGLLLPDAFLEIRSIYNQLGQSGVHSIVERINAIQLGVASLPKSGATGWAQAISDAALGGELVESEGLI